MVVGSEAKRGQSGAIRPWGEARERRQIRAVSLAFTSPVDLPECAPWRTRASNRRQGNPCSPKFRSARCGATGAMRAAFVAHLRRRLRLGEVALCIKKCSYKQEETLPESCGAEAPGSAFCTQPARLNVRTGNRKQVRESMGGALSRRFEMFTRQHTGCGPCRRPCNGAAWPAPGLPGPARWASPQPEPQPPAGSARSPSDALLTHPRCTVITARNVSQVTLAESGGRDSNPRTASLEGERAIRADARQMSPPACAGGMARIRLASSLRACELPHGTEVRMRRDRLLRRIGARVALHHGQ